MSRLSRDDILKLARLSRLQLSEDEISKFQAEISAILDYVETLDSVDTTGLSPTYQVTGLKNVMRGDVEIKYQAQSKALLQNAPATQNNQFKVKRVL